MGAWCQQNPPRLSLTVASSLGPSLSSRGTRNPPGGQGSCVASIRYWKFIFWVKYETTKYTVPLKARISDFYNCINIPLKTSLWRWYLQYWGRTSRSHFFAPTAGGRWGLPPGERSVATPRRARWSRDQGWSVLPKKSVLRIQISHLLDEPSCSMRPVCPQGLWTQDWTWSQSERRKVSVR